MSKIYIFTCQWCEKKYELNKTNEVKEIDESIEEVPIRPPRVGSIYQAIMCNRCHDLSLRRFKGLWPNLVLK